MVYLKRIDVDNSTNKVSIFYSRPHACKNPKRKFQHAKLGGAAFNPNLLFSTSKSTPSEGGNKKLTETEFYMAKQLLEARSSNLIKTIKQIEANWFGTKVSNVNGAKQMVKKWKT